jgi:hypothetical protein
MNRTAAYRRKYRYCVDDAQFIDNPGEFLMNKYCPESFCCDYWPGTPIGEYLCNNTELAIHESFFYIRNICNKRQLEQWEKFIEEYKNYAQQMDTYALFCLEYHGEGEASKLPCVVFEIKNYDCHVFCLGAACQTDGESWMKEYAAELALRIGENDPELCGAVLSDTSLLIQNPVPYCLSVVRNFVYSDNRPFSAKIDSSFIASAQWQAQISICFPIIEHYRLNLIDKYQYSLTSFLPMSNGYNDDNVTDVCDLEINVLFFISNQNRGLFTSKERENIVFLRNVRNKLAHIECLNMGEMQKLFLL